MSIVFWTDTWRPESFYDKIKKNRDMGLHTLCLLGKHFLWVFVNEMLYLDRKLYDVAQLAGSPVCPLAHMSPSNYLSMHVCCIFNSHCSNECVKTRCDDPRILTSRQIGISLRVAPGAHIKLGPVANALVPPRQMVANNLRLNLCALEISSQLSINPQKYQWDFPVEGIFGNECW